MKLHKKKHPAPPRDEATAPAVEPEDGESAALKSAATSGPAIARSILAWYGSSHRDLPWRRTSDPYHVWVSEIMLQQTTVKTATPYFEAFIESYPTAQALARAPLDDVLSRWSGLGYYTRARNLHRAAGIVVSEFDGRVPDEPGALGSLPGIGDYTRAAILSIAFEKPHPVVDGNVIRVLSRLAGWKGDPKSPMLKRRVAHLAEALIPKNSPGDYNQGLMELGATVCKPRQADCRLCPLSDFCAARDSGSPEQYPGVAKQPRPIQTVYGMVLLRESDLYYMVKRDTSGMLKEFWEFPGVEMPAKTEAPDRVVNDHVQEALQCSMSLGDQAIEARHSIMNRRITVRAWPATVTSGRPQGGEWISKDSFKDYPISTMCLKILRKFESQRTA